MAAPPFGYELPSDSEFRLFQTFVERAAGIHLGLEKKALLQARLSRRMRELQLPTFVAYYRYATKGPASATETQTLLDLITTNETSFFRELQHFEFVRERVIPAWRAQEQAGLRPASVRVWSAGCSTGEEPYSIAMLLAHELGRVGWRIEIVASDISRRVLSKASAALWPIERATQIPEVYRDEYMLRGTGRSVGLMKATRELRELVRFRYFNLTGEQRMEGVFDLIFCRNVLIYFAPDTKRKVVTRLLEHLPPKGFLFLGHAETLADGQENVRCVGPNIYALKGSTYE